MTFPELCIGVCTYRRPWYAIQTISLLNGWLHYGGPLRFHIADGGSEAEDIEYYKRILVNRQVSVEVTNNLADMCNSVAHHGGDLWMTIMDDYFLRYPLNVEPDVLLLLEHPEVGVVRMNRMSYWGHGHGPETSADLISNTSQLHWWRLDKERTKDPYMSGIGVHLYHRRYWDAYGDILACPPNRPGEAELNGNARFWARPGPTVAVPMRFGEDYNENHYEPFWHAGSWRTDEYKSVVGSRL